MKLRTKIMMIALLPVFILGIGIFILAAEETANGIYDESYDGMQAASLAVRDIFEVGNQGDYHIDEDGNLWKGDTLNISQSVGIVEHIKESTGMDVTIFWGDERILTSIKDKTGKPQLKTKASAAVVQKVMKEGEYYLDRDVEIMGSEYVVCYAPFYQEGENDGEAVGMVFVGKPCSGVLKIIYKIQRQMLIVILAVLLVTGILVTGLVKRIVRALGNSMEFLKRISEGDLTVELDRVILKRSDEVGLLGKEISELRDRLRSIIDVINEKSKKLDLEAEVLKGRAGNILQAMNGIEQSSQEMSVSCVRQAEDADAAGNNVTIIGDMIGNNNGEIRKMHEVSNHIKSVSGQMMAEIQELNEDMRQVRKSMGYLGQQTSLTKESVDRIGSATEMIAAVAAQTSLLSLNASIEAARAGELGKGFGVVASEIQKLSIQANASVEDIRNVVDSLTENSDHTVKRMEEVQAVIKNQENTIRKTGQVFEDVRNGIEKSVNRMDMVLGKSEEMEEVREDMVAAVQNSAAMAQENAASIEEMMASVESIYEEIRVLSEETNELKESSVQMKESIGMFRYGK